MIPSRLYSPWQAVLRKGTTQQIKTLSQVNVTWSQPIRPIFQPDYRLYHNSSLLCKGRHTGSKALDPPPRSLSKKQKKRKAELKIQKSEVRDPAKERVKDNLMKKKIENDKVGYEGFVEELERSTQSLFEMMQRPTGSLFESSDKEQLKLDIDRAEKFLRNLKRSVKNQAVTMNDSNTGKALSTRSTTNSDIEALNNIDEANNSLQILAKNNRANQADEIYELMIRSKMSISPESLEAMIKVKTMKKQYALAEGIFNNIVAQSLPSIEAWNALIACKAESGKPDDAVQTIDTILMKGGISPTVDMLNSILKAYVNKGKAKINEVVQTWHRMHQGNALNLESFHIMLRYCSKSSQAEKAFFYFDELKVLNIEPTIETFVRLIRAAAEAPHWVHGFHDIIFDAMTYFEGAELEPTVELYNAIIHAFGKAGDGTASEFYFWEMIRKGIEPTEETFNSLLFSYARSCSVGAKYYGYKGRYVRPLDRKLRKDSQALADLGPAGIIPHLSKGISHDGLLERGRRQSAPYLDDLDDNPEYAEAMMEQIRMEAIEVRKDRKEREEKRQKLLDNNVKKEESRDDFIDMNDLDKSNIASLFDGLTVKDDQIIDSSGASLNATKEELDLFQELMGSFSSSNNMISKGNMSPESELEAVDDESSEKPRTGRKKRPPIRRRKSGSATSQDVDHLEAEYTPVASSEVEDRKTQVQEASNLSKSSKSINIDERFIRDMEFFEKGIEIDKSDTIDDDPLSEDSQDTRDLFRMIYPIIPEMRKCQREMRFGEKFVDPFIGNIPISSSSGLGGEQSRDLKRLEENKLLKVLDGTLSKKDIEKLQDATSAADDWDQIEFGKAPNPDYSLTLPMRRRIFTHRAGVAFQDLLDRKIKPSSYCLNSLLSVYAEALMVDKALEVFESFDLYKVTYDTSTYRALIRMHVRTKNIEEAVNRKNEAIQKNISVAAESYGILVESFMHRGNLIDALKVVEEAADRNIKIPEYSLRHIRSRCKKLGIEHPNISEDPNQWVKDIKKMRRDQANTSDSRIHDIRSVII